MALEEATNGNGAATTESAAPAPVDVKPAGESSTPAPVKTQDSAPVNSATETQVPFGKNPEIQKYLDRQTRKAIQEERARWDKEHQSFKDQLLLSRTPEKTPSGPQLTQEQKEARAQLAELLFGDPEIRDKYGLSKVDKLEKFQQEAQLERSREMFESELGPLVKQYAEEYGMDPKELDEDIREFIETDEWFADKSFSRGAAKKAMRLFFDGKDSELAERKANLKLIREQAEKKKIGTESASRTEKTGSAPKEKGILTYLERRAQEEGGISFD